MMICKAEGFDDGELRTTFFFKAPDDCSRDKLYKFASVHLGSEMLTSIAIEFLCRDDLPVLEVT